MDESTKALYSRGLRLSTSPGVIRNFRSSPRSLHIRCSLIRRTSPWKIFLFELFPWMFYEYGFSSSCIPVRGYCLRSWSLCTCPKVLSWWTEPMGWLPFFPFPQNGYMRQPLEKDGAYACRSFLDRNASDNDSPNHGQVSWQAWFQLWTSWKHGVFTPCGRFKRIFCHHGIKKIALIICLTK